MNTNPVGTGTPPAQTPSTQNPSTPPTAGQPPAPSAPPSAPPAQKDTFETKVSGGDVKVEKKGDTKKEVKKEVEKKGGSESPKAKDPAGPSVTVVKGSAEKKVGDDFGPGASVSGKFDVQLNSSGLDVNGSLKLDAHALNATGKVEKTFEFEYGGEKFKATVQLEGGLKIGGDANLKLNFKVGTDGVVRVNLGAEGFVGAKGELKGTIKLESKPASSPDSEYKPLVEGSASVSAWAGAAAGAKFNVTGDIKSGKIGFEAKAFASLGVGAGFGLEGSVNVPNVLALGGRIGMKFANDVGTAINLPGATMDLIDAYREAGRLDEKVKAVAGKAHAIDAWNRQGYSKLLPSERLEKAMGILSRRDRYDMVDTAAGIGRKDGIIGLVDVEAAMRNEDFPEEVRAAAYELYKQWDKVNQGGVIQDNGRGNPWAKAYSPDVQKQRTREDKVELARRDMVAKQADLQRRYGVLAAELNGADTPDKLKAVIAKIDAELGQIDQWGSVTNVDGGCGHDAVAHENNLRALREQAMKELNMKKAG
jgi:hypothetical protein